MNDNIGLSDFMAKNIPQIGSTSHISIATIMLG
jgi:hypothetical protein